MTDKYATAIRSRGDSNLVQSDDVPAASQSDHLMKENAALREALRAVRFSLFEANTNVGSISDTLWMADSISLNETVLDYIDAALEPPTSGDSTGSQDDQRLIETKNGGQP